MGRNGEPLADIEGEMVATDNDSVASMLENAKEIIIVPGYGMAVAQAQSSISELTKRLRNRGKMLDSQSIPLQEDYLDI